MKFKPGRKFVAHQGTTLNSGGVTETIDSSAWPFLKRRILVAGRTIARLRLTLPCGGWCETLLPVCRHGGKGRVRKVVSAWRKSGAQKFSCPPSFFLDPIYYHGNITIIMKSV
jgi:hypothetical protein